MLAIVAVAYIRRLNPTWIMLVPAIGGLAVGGCLIVAGQRADHAASAVEGSAAFGAIPNASCLVSCAETP